MNIESLRVSSSPTLAASPVTAQPLKPSLQTATQDVKKQPEPTKEALTQAGMDLSDAVSKISNFISKISSEISFTVDETSGQRIVQVLDSQSKEVIRQIPSEEAIQLAQALDKIQGLFIKDKA